jgi:hypothetical protein
MKSKAAVIWFVVSLILGAALVVQWKGSRKQKVKLEQLQVQVEKNATGDGEIKMRVKELEKERMKLTAELRAAEFELSKAQNPYSVAAQTTNSPHAAQLQAALRAQGREQGNEGAGGMGKMLGNMLKDPEMRKAMEQQQRMGMDMIYGSLIKQLQLSPEQEKKFKDMLLAQQMDNMSQAGAMFEGGGTDRAKVAQELAEKHKQNQEQIKEILGEEKYAQYEDYNQTLGERMMLDQFGKTAEISPEQSEQLLGIMREEKKNVQINRGAEPLDPTKDWQKVLGSGEAAQQMFAQQEEVNQRVLERAGQVLTPEQLQKFAPVLKSQLEMQKAGMKMAQQMFGGEKNNGPGAPPQPVQPVQEQ